jgi:hypothetical protein
MEVNKFHELCSAYGTAQSNFETYKTDCHILSMEIVKELKKYFQIPESQFSLYQINEKGGFDLVTPALIHAIELGEDRYWHFGIGITVCQAPETLPEELILIHLMFRKNDKDECFIKYVHSKTDYQVEKGKSESFIPFFDFLHKTIITSYQGQLQQFIGEKTERKLGYRQ